MPDTLEALTIWLLLLIPGLLMLLSVYPTVGIHSAWTVLLGRSALATGLYNLGGYSIVRCLLRKSPVGLLNALRAGPTDDSFLWLLLYFLFLPAAIGLVLRVIVHHPRTPRPIVRCLKWLVGIEVFTSGTPSELVPTAWDHVFRGQEELWVIAAMTDGSVAHGLFNFSSSYPHQPQIYLKPVWKTVAGTTQKIMINGEIAGCLISFDKVVSLDIAKWTGGDESGQGKTEVSSKA